ncbi:hypothetical protein ACFLQN_03275 [Candidatus Aenigmatarchaeota archaeon]
MAFDNYNLAIKHEPVEHNKKRNPYMYLCRNCRRSFMSPEPTQNCKFCGDGVEQMHNELFNRKVIRKKYHYFCKNCEKDFIVFGKRLACDCGHKITKITLLDRVGLWKFLTENFPWLKKLEVQKEDVIIEIKDNKIRSTSPQTTAVKETLKEKLIKLPYALDHIKLPKRSIKYSEEIPTDYIEKTYKNEFEA